MSIVHTVPGAGATNAPVKKHIAQGLNSWILVFIIILLIVLAVRWANEFTEFRLPDSLLQPLATLAVVAGIYLLAALFVRFTVRVSVHLFASGSHVEQQLILRKFYIAFVYFAATILALWKLGLSAGNLTVFLGLATTGFGFAIRDILASYFVWFMLLTKKPFRMGDYIRIGEDEGRVMHIGTFYVVLDENPDTRQDYVRVPNQRFMQKSFYNYGHEQLLVQVRVPLEEFSEDVDARLERVQHDLAQEHPSPRVGLDMYEGKVVVFIETHTDESSRGPVRDKIIRAVIREFGAKAVKAEKRVRGRSSKKKVIRATTVPGARKLGALRKAHTPNQKKK